MTLRTLAVRIVAGPADQSGCRYRAQWRIQELGAIVGVQIQDLARQALMDAVHAASTHSARLSRSPAQLTEPVATSTSVNAYRNAPAPIQPQWATRSTSTKPGTVSLQSAKVLIRDLVGLGENPRPDKMAEQVNRWTRRHLSEPEQALFRRLSVFAGGWTVPAARASCGLTDEIPSDVALDLLARLVDRSLVQVESVSNAVVRYGLLETIREYALEQLRANGEEARLRQRHAAYFWLSAEEAEPELWGARPEPWLRRLAPDLDNARAALQWSIDSGDEHTALKLRAALGRFWLMMGRYREGQVWVTRLLRLACAEDPTLIRAKLLRANASLWAFQGDAAHCASRLSSY